MELQKSIDSYKELHEYLERLRKKENKIISDNLEMEEKILCVSRANMYLPNALFMAKKNMLTNIMNNKILLFQNQNTNGNSMEQLYAVNKIEKKEINEKQQAINELETEYKEKLYQRLGIDGGFDLWSYWNQLKMKNKIMSSQIEIKKNDIEYMENRMKL